MMPQMRTITQAVEWLRERDPGTAITPTALRRLVTTGKIPSVRVGSKYLIDMQTLAQHLQGDIHYSQRKSPDTPPADGDIEKGGNQI